MWRYDGYRLAAASLRRQPFLPRQRRRVVMASARRTGCALALASALVSALPGCAVGPDYKQPDMPLPELLISAPDASVAGQPEVRWWGSLGDPTLTRLIEQAVRRSPSIRIAQARIDEARANYRIFFYDYFP